MVAPEVGPDDFRIYGFSSVETLQMKFQFFYSVEEFQ